MVLLMTKNNNKKKDENMNSTSTPLSDNPTRDLGFFAELLQQLRLVWYLLKDKDVPIYLKLIPVASLVYLIVPIDIIPDMLPGLGQLDDLGVIVLGLKMFIDMSPKDLVDYYLAELKGLNGKAPETDAYKKAHEPIVIDADDVR
jgi:uncharacterized membrane protein YkvA (DUF1232 family)